MSQRERERGKFLKAIPGNEINKRCGKIDPLGRDGDAFEVRNEILKVTTCS